MFYTALNVSAYIMFQYIMLFSGHYGAFLQEDWDLIHSIVRKASSDLPIPVTCKMRILPGDFRKSVEYARYGTF